MYPQSLFRAYITKKITFFHLKLFVFVAINSAIIEWACFCNEDRICAQLRLGPACACTQSDQSMQAILWVAKDSMHLQMDSED